MTRSLNLDSMFIPVPFPEIEHTFIQFSAGEWHITLNNHINYNEIIKVVISTRIKNGEDIIKLILAKNALELKGIKQFELIMPYIPYSRQDRLCNPGEAFSLKEFANIINSLNFNQIITIDAHSNVAPALLNNCKNLSNIPYVKDVLDYINCSPYIIIPDIGAATKAKTIAKEFNLLTIQCDKIRNTKTGELSGFRVYHDNCVELPCLIVDDICDGGGTFIGLAAELKKKNCGKLYLFTTFGIYSKGTEIFKDIFDGVYCTNGFSTINDPIIKQISIYI